LSTIENLQTPPPGPGQVWHHRIHQQWAGEDLTFWRLAFFPRYDREQVLRVIHAVMGGEGVRSYAIYETLGLFDLFVRAWLPAHTSEQIGEALNKALKSESLQLIEPFIVTSVLRHHVWDDKDEEETRKPHSTMLLEPMGDGEIERLNRGELADDERRKLYEDGVLAQLDKAEGVKFFIVITSAVFSITWGAREELKKGLLTALDESGIKEPSLYEGSGFGQYVVMGRAPQLDFFSITKLSTAINDLGIGHLVTARPYTHVCAQEDTLWYADRLPTMRHDGPAEIDSILEQPESQMFEVKGSLRLNLARWLNNEHESKAVADDAVVNEGVLRAAVGMLNADGGQIVVGALERNARFGEHLAEDHPRLSGFPRRGPYICVGVNDEYGDKEWDGFQLDLQNLMGARIQPSPSGSFTVTRETVEGRDLCVISIRPSPVNWFYRFTGPKDPVKFYVREGNRTVAYAGMSADAYKRERPRG
jgi:hypothetical protein